VFHYRYCKNMNFLPYFYVTMKINKCRPITALLVKLICYEKF
jgi:hypothetical protein